MSVAPPSFAALFGRDVETVADAPGRVNLIGEHTDYNDGYVLPTAIPQRCRVELSRRADRRVRVVSVQAHGAPAEYRLGEETPAHDWADYVRGCTRELARAGHPIGGFDARVDSRVPVGAGVSSSAALEVSVLRALRAAFAFALDDVALALVGHRAEDRFVGARVGIMDQMAASLADEETALFLDTRSIIHERVPIPTAVDVVVIDSGVSHRHASGDYNRRRAECERAAALLGVRALRDLAPADTARIGALPPPLAGRARHVVSENARVLDAVAALRAGDVARLGVLFYASHASQRDDYAVSIPETDLLVELARADGDVHGARLTGGGFGGSVVVLAVAGRGAEVAARIAGAYRRQSGRIATTLVPDPAGKRGT